jgi:methylenetetrahydrofolate reductase (NADPH)
MAKLTEVLQKAKKTVFSFEILPPVKGKSIENLFDAIDDLMEFKPAFIDVTYHREDIVPKKDKDGNLEMKTIWKRPGTVGICTAIMHKYDVDAIPHLLCGGFTKEETENVLIDLQFHGIDNILALRGDAVKSQGRFIPTPGGNIYATDLIEQIANMNKGQYLDNELENGVPTDFCIGGACYPEKHFEAPNLETDIKYLKKKMELGAEYVVTQMFFDNQKYFDFVDRVRAEGIDIPIIPGLKPITTVRHQTVLPSIFHLDLPTDLVAELEKCSNNKEAKQVGIEWCIQQSKELMERGVPCLHYYSMSRSTAVKEVAAAIF